VKKKTTITANNRKNIQIKQEHSRSMTTAHLIKKTAPLLFLLGATALSTGCKDSRLEYSEMMYEPAKVTQKEHHGSWIQPMMVGKVWTYIHHPEQNILRFSGEIPFRIDDKSLYKRLNTNDSVTVSYREVYKITMDDINNDGLKEDIAVAIKGCEFFDAVKK
jgi:hypothetical protein